MSALQDMVDDMVAEHETSPAAHFPELGTERRAEGPADETHVGASRWLSDRSVGQQLWAVSSSNIAGVLLCLIATCLGGYFALEARNERMAISSASIMAERMVADIGVLDFQQGRYQDAVTRLGAAVELREGRTEILRWLGRALAKTGKRHEGFYRLAMASEREGRSAQALDYYQRALEGLDDGNPLTEKVRERVEFLQDQMPVGPGGIPRPGPRSSKERED